MVCVRVLTGIAFLVCGTGFLHGQANDTIEPVQGRAIRCAIKGTTPQGIQYEIGGQPQQIGVAEIKSVKFSGEPGEFAKARNRLDSGQYDDALTELQKVNASELQEVEKAEFAYLNAIAAVKKSLRDGSLPTRDAATIVSKFLKDFPNSFHFYEMTEYFGWLAFHTGEFAAAEKAFEPLTASAIPSLELAGYLGLARTALELGQWGDVQTQLTAIANQAANDDQSQEIKLIGKCLAARILAEQNQAPQAIAMLEEIIQSENSERSRVFANVYNSLGLVQLRAGDPKSAKLAFLHTDQLYSNETDLHAEALYYLATIWAQLNETDRANRAKQTLSQQYRNSLWASKQ